MTTVINLKKGGKYQFKGSLEVIVFLGHEFIGGRFWYQFALDGESEVWCELKPIDLELLIEIKEENNDE